MKGLITAILVVSLITGCASKQLYNIPDGKTKADFILEREECAMSSGYGDGSFIFGPIIIIIPIAIIMAIIKNNQKKDFEKCMLANGYICRLNCNYAEEQSEPIGQE